MRIASVLILALPLFTSPVLADSLDRPATPSHPTVKSELIRGQEVAFECSINDHADINAFSNCIESAKRKQLVRATSTDAFSLGLYFKAAGEIKIFLDEGDTGVARALCKQYALEVIDFEKKLNVSDERLVKLFEYKPAAVQKMKAIKAECAR